MTDSVPRSKQDWLLLVGLFCFFFSGAAGLIYQVVWTRMLTQIFGNTTYAIATVLSAFMAGLAIGSYLFGQIADRGKNDFLLYGILEAGVGVYGFLVPWIFQMAQKVYGPIFGLNESYPFLFNLVLFFLSFVLLVFPTMLMGATLPVLSRFFVRSFAQFGRRVGDLYATNTLGAVIGCAAGGFFLIPTLGMRMTVFVAASVNLVIAAAILLIDRLRDKTPLEIVPPTAAEETAAAESQGSSRLAWVVLTSFALSGFASLVYENAWTRSLTLVIGSSIYSFSTMLVTFLIGLALGGFIYARVLGGREARLNTFGLIELWVGLSALATIPLFERLPLIFVRLLHGFGDTFTVFLYLQIFLSALVMFIPTVLLGMTFPLVARLFTQSVYRVGSGVGSSYAANTVGAVARRFCRRLYLDPQPRRAKHHYFRCRPESFDRRLAGDQRLETLLCAALRSRPGGTGVGDHRAFQGASLGSARSHQRRDDLCRSLRIVADRFLAGRGNEAGRRAFLPRGIDHHCQRAQHPGQRLRLF